MERYRYRPMIYMVWAQGKAIFLQNLCRAGKAIDQLLLTEIPEGADGMDDSPDEGPGAVPGRGCGAPATGRHNARGPKLHLLSPAHGTRPQERASLQVGLPENRWYWKNSYIRDGLMSFSHCFRGYIHLSWGEMFSFNGLGEFLHGVMNAYI